MSKLIQIATLLFVLGAAALVSAFQYQVVVQTGHFFDPTTGSLNVSISSQNSRSQEFVVVNNREIRKVSQYSVTVDLPFNVQTIQSAAVHFVLKNPHSLINRRITVDKVMMVPVYIQNPNFRVMETVNLTTKAPVAVINHNTAYTFLRNP